MYASVQNWKLAEIYFAKDRMVPEENRFLKRFYRIKILRILGNAISSGKKKQTNKKSHKSLFKSLWKNTWKYMKLKYLDQLRKKTSIACSWSWSQSPIDNCFSLFIRHIEYKAQATGYKYRLYSHSLQQSRRQYSFRSLLYQNQLAVSNNFITSFVWVSEWRPRE